MKKFFVFILLFVFAVSGCSAKKINNDAYLEKKVILINGKKKTLYIDKSEKSIKTGNKKYIILYTSNRKTPYTRLLVNNKLMVYIPKNSDIKSIESKYQIKFIKYINEKLRLALFKTDLKNVLNVVNRLNEDGIKAGINYKKQWKLY